MYSPNSPRSERFSKFHTDIDEIDLKNEQLIIRGKNLCDEMIGEMDFIDTIYHTLLNKIPDAKEKKLLSASLTSIHAGHQVAPPTIHAARVAASTGASVTQSMIAGWASSGILHLGAINPTMREYLKLEKIVRPDKVYEDTRKIAGKKIKKHEMVFGFGHPYMKKDPRPDALRKLVSELEYETKYIIMHDAIRDEIYERKKKYSNVDGINAAIFLSLGFSPEDGEGLFQIGRGIGMLAHVVEEKSKKPWYAWGTLIAKNVIEGLEEEIQKNG